MAVICINEIHNRAFEESTLFFTPPPPILIMSKVKYRITVLDSDYKFHLTFMNTFSASSRINGVTTEYGIELCFEKCR